MRLRHVVFVSEYHLNQVTVASQVPRARREVQDSTLYEAPS